MFLRLFSFISIEDWLKFEAFMLNIDRQIIPTNTTHLFFPSKIEYFSIIHTKIQPKYFDTQFTQVSIRWDAWNCNRLKVLNFHSQIMKIKSFEKSKKWKQFVQSTSSSQNIHSFIHVTWVFVSLYETPKIKPLWNNGKFYRQPLIDYWILIKSNWWYLL